MTLEMPKIQKSTNNAIQDHAMLQFTWKFDESARNPYCDKITTHLEQIMFSTGIDEGQLSPYAISSVTIHVTAILQVGQQKFWLSWYLWWAWGAGLFCPYATQCREPCYSYPGNLVNQHITPIELLCWWGNLVRIISLMSMKTVKLAHIQYHQRECSSGTTKMTMKILSQYMHYHPQQNNPMLQCALFWCWVPLCAPFTNSLIECYFIMMVATLIGIFMAILLILI